MIDKIFYKLFSGIDKLFMKVEEALTFNWPNCKKKKKK
jgi:hypothetical protein